MFSDAGLITWESYFPNAQITSGEFGPYGASLFMDVYKALDVQPGIPHVGPNATALAVEDLSPVLASAEMREEQLNLWNNMPKEEAYSLDVEFTRLETFGEDGMDGFIASNDAGIVSDPRFYRGLKTVKYLAVKGQVTLPAQAVNLVGFRGVGKNAMDTSEEIKMRELLRHIERNLWWGNSTVNPLMWDGFFKQIDDGADMQNSIRLDMQGAPADKNLLEYVAQIATNNSTEFTDLYFPNEGIRDLRQSLFPEQRLNENARDGSVGAAFDRFLVEALNGNPRYMQIRRNQMLTLGVKGGIPRNIPPNTSVNGPSSSGATVTGAGAANVALPYRPGLPAGTYYYTAVPVGKGGWGAPVTSAGIAATIGQKINLTISFADATIEYFLLFRNPADQQTSATSAQKFMAMVNRSGGSTTYTDDGYAVPNTYHICGLTMTSDEIVFKQLLPVVKRPLPQDLMSNSYGILMFGTPLFKVPLHNLHVVNVGSLSQAGITSM
jgi:hypothetical protein